MQKIVCELCRSSDFTKDDDGLFVCDFCRTKYTATQAQSMMVEGTVRLDRSGDAANLVTMSTNALASGNFQEAYDYANRALEIDPGNAQAWYLKGSATGLQSTLGNSRMAEMVFAFEKAIEHVGDEGQAQMRVQCSDQAMKCAATVEAASWQNALETASIDGVWIRHVALAQEAMSCLGSSYSWNPQRLALDYYVSMASRMIGGIKYSIPNEKGVQHGVRTLSHQEAAHVRSQIAWASDEIRKFDPQYVTPNPTALKKDMCFVVTATMGDEQALPVVTLRDFRDNVLTDVAWGRRFIRWYGTRGPELARVIEGSRVRRATSLVVIVVPATAVAWLCLRLRRPSA